MSRRLVTLEDAVAEVVKKHGGQSEEEVAQPRFNTELKPYAMLLAGMDADLQSLEDPDVLDLRDMCEMPTRTNCWCYTYRAAQILKLMLDEQISMRRLVWPRVPEQG